MTINFLIRENGHYVCPTYLKELQLEGHLCPGSRVETRVRMCGEGDRRMFSGRRERAGQKQRLTMPGKSGGQTYEVGAGGGREG